jgi:hypothetical protein
MPLCFRYLILIILIAYSGIAYTQKLSLITEGGYSYRLMLPPDSITNSYKSYLEGKKPGSNYALELVWFNDNNGIGIKYTTFLSSISRNNVEILRGFRINKSENIQVNYYSFQFHSRKRLMESRFYGELAGGLGVIYYYNKANELTEKLDIEGKTYGLDASITCDYIIHRNVSIFVSTHLFLANLSEQTKNGNKEILNPKESLSRIDCNGGIRISLNFQQQTN